MFIDETIFIYIYIYFKVSIIEAKNLQKFKLDFLLDYNFSSY